MTKLRAVAGLVAFLGALMIACLTVACGSNPNEHIQSNEFFRPAVDGDSERSSTADDADQSGQEQEGSAAQTEQAESADQQSTSADQTDQADQQDAPQEQATADEPGEQDDGDSSPSQDAGPIETSDDIVRRYTNPSYGYSFELICSPFCDPNSNGIDRVSFLSETGRALIGVDVVEDDGSDSEALLQAALSLPDGVEFEAITDTTTVTGEAAERYDWDEDRRATGGFQVRWHALLIRVADVAIVLRAGAVLEDYEGVAPALERALTTFILPLELTARPGRYDRFDFVIGYDPADVSQEFGQPTSNPPSAEAGIFVLQSATALKAVLTWQVLGEAFYDGDTAIQQSLRESLGIENVSGLREWSSVDGQPARTGETETQFGEGLMKIQSFAWYCRDGGREFALHVLDPDDPESVALPLIESFRCSADGDGEAAEADGDEQ